MAVVAPPPSHKTNLPSSSDADLGILHEVLHELDRERAKKAELEQQVRMLLAERKQQNSGDDFTISRKHYMALQTELQGYRDLIQAMTMERPAIRQAVVTSTRRKILSSSSSSDSSASNSPPTLPLHVVRLLEIMPWDPRASEYASAKEELYEWQFYDARQQTWQSEVRKSPKFFQTLPTEEPKPGAHSEQVIYNNQHRPILGFFVGNQDSAPLPSSCVLTNHGITKLYNLHKGYPLPENGGTWQWVGGWRVEKRATIEQPQQSQRVDCDDDGWSYAMEATHFLLNPAETCWDNPGLDDTSTKLLRPVRRRKWTRQRALVDYPYASESTKWFLSLMAQRLYATTAAHKTSEQLVDTKVSLTELESVLLHCNDQVTRQIRLLEEVRKAVKGKDQKETRQKIAAASDLAHQMQMDMVKALSFSSRERNCPSSPL